MCNTVPARHNRESIAMIEDRLLLVRFKSGSSAALRRIYEKYSNTLLKLAFALSKDINMAEDTVHDVFVNFAQSAETIRTDGNLKSYLATCVANRIRNTIKRSRREQPLDPDTAGRLCSNLKRPEQWVICAEQLRMLNDAMGQLPYEQREVILLHLEGGMRFRSIARLQSVSLNTVQSRYRYGLQKLRTVLDGEVET